jgi:disulfide bond formation protein DsbB
MDARVKLLGVEYALWGLGLFAAIAVVALVTALRRTR